MTVSLITFNIFQDHFLELSGVSDVQIQDNIDMPSQPLVEFGAGAASAVSAEEIEAKMQAIAYIQKSILKYFNIYSFALLTLYTLVGLFLERKTIIQSI
tara:strand:- start:1289 stop:1585 length:297 start_codon:yes stop_codon:yes gene_type:complete